MQKLQGVGVSLGIAVGRAKVLNRQPLQVASRSIDASDVSSELVRFRSALEHIGNDISRLLDSFSFGKNERDILDTHRLILQDPELIKSVERMVRDDLICLEHAVSRHFQKAAKLFDEMEDDYMAQRIADYREINQRLLRHLQGNEQKIELDTDTILVVDEIPVSLLMKLSRDKLRGIVTDKGSRTSHAAIVARSLGLPVVVGLRDVITEVEDNAHCILDGQSGQLIINPDSHTSDVYEQLLSNQEQHREDLLKLVEQETATADGTRIHLRLNIELPEEMDHVLHLSEDGVGLFRTEFLFMDRSSLPTEEEQYIIYREVAEKLLPAPLVIRTVDIGGDKLSNLLNIEPEKNPALGCRGIRLSLEHPDLFRTQIMAILRAAVTGNIRVMLPLISCVEQVQRSRKLIRTCEQELAQRGREFRRNVPLGVMIETPAAAMISSVLATECDFFSIGTNDLIQYTLAVDRASDTVADQFDPYHPAVLHLITLTVQNARKHNLPVSICGEMAAESDFIPFLIGLGLHDLSVSPGIYLTAKENIMRVQSSDIVDLVLDVLDAECSAEVKQRIRDWHKASRKSR
ncbi:MAG: phosphoenolpyruvate--protein phosphotransferase [Candidatus Cloacimonetes bacterium]|nr:phosphoenolpyruvate--protein phosphotransferase [Candidatus Cloacimonadota bacterium]